MLPEFEVQRDAVELPFAEHSTGIFVAVGLSDVKPNFRGDAADCGTMDKYVVDNQQAGAVLG